MLAYLIWDDHCILSGGGTRDGQGRSRQRDIGESPLPLSSDTSAVVGDLEGTSLVIV